MKKNPPVLRRPVRLSASIATLVASGLALLSAHAANKTWDGGGQNNNWLTAPNWDANTAPVPGDALSFTGTTRLANTNNFPSGTGFNGISFASPAGAFTLWGNSISLDGDISNNQPVTTETINLPLALSATRSVSVTESASLTIGGAISGGFGLTKTGGGLLTLSGANTLSGPVTILAGTLSAASDANLGAVPGAPTAGNIVINDGALRTTSTLTLAANRGIALGPTAGSGTGRIDVNTGATLTYQGIIANNGGGTGGLTKGSFGALILSGANTYAGPTVIKNGTITLDFTQTDSPLNNVISSVSALTLGGENAGLGAANFAALNMSAKLATVNNQTFTGTLVDIGPAIIRATNGTANLNLGALTHNPGGYLVLVTNTAGNGGNINTPTPNTQGILGVWATIGNGTIFNNVTMGTDYAAVDGSGNLVPYSGYTVYQNAMGNVHSFATPATNLRIDGSSSGDVRINAESAGETTDLNTINLSATRAFSLIIGANNTLRFGRFGGIFKSDFVNNITWALGSGTTGGGNGVPNSGTVTAGGAPDTAGEIVFAMNNNTSQSQGSLNLEARVTDNGSGAVTLIKSGPQAMKLRGQNTHSGGLYLLQGRLQLAGTEIGLANPGGAGTGPIFILPGAQLFPSGVGDFNATGVAISNSIFMGGLGTQQEQFGAIRFGNGIRIAGDITLIGDSRLAGGNGGATGISGKIGGPFNLDFGALATVNAVFTVFNPSNDWSGTTTFNARAGGNNVISSGADEIIPNGFGKGNVVMNGASTANTATWNVSGFDETINGLSTINNTDNVFIQNNAATPSILTVGDNNQSGTFGGAINGDIALTKIGGGAQTLSGANSYTGDTTVSGGTLALSGSGSLASPNILVRNGAALDVSGLSAGFSAAGAIGMSNGTLVVGETTANMQNLNLTNSGLTVALDPALINVTTTTLTNGGATNLINIAAVLNISAYPATFTVIDYSGVIGGVGNNFGFGEVPNPNTVGSISNDVANSRIVLTLTDGPKPLTWAGTDPVNPTLWDIGTTTNWLAFKGTPNQVPIDFNTADFALFDDTGSTNNVNITSIVEPGGLTVNNPTLNYTFSGVGSINGAGTLRKQGAGTLTLTNSGLSSFRGGVTVEGGTVVFAQDNSILGGITLALNTTVQVGAGGGTGTLPAGIVDNEGSLIFNRTGNLSVPNVIRGAGPLTNVGAGVVTLSAANTFSGTVTVAQGTLRVDNNSALGTSDVGTTIASGATLDVGGPGYALNATDLGAEAITVSGTGVGGNGAIVNNSANGQQNALENVTLTADATFGGTSRWDIRGGVAALSTGGSPFHLTKVGANQVSLVAVMADAALANINVSNGIFAVETTTTLGNPASTLTVAAGATVQFFNNNATLIDKVMVLNGNGTANTVNNASGANTVASSVTLGGAAVMNVGGTSLAFNEPIGGSGSLTKVGGNTLILNGTNSYSGGTTNSAGTLAINGLNNGGGALTNLAGATLAGRGTYTGAVGSRGTIVPGDSAGTLSTGPLTLNGAQIVFELGTNDVNQTFPVSDLIAVTGNLTLAGVTTNRLVPGPIGVLTNGQTIPLITYTGTLTGGSNNFALIASPGYAFTLLDPATTPGAIRVRVDATPATLNWRGLAVGNPSAWDIGTTLNWVDGGAPSDFLNSDAATFNDQGLTNRVDLVGTLQPDSITMNNSALTYTFAGTGRVTGTRLTLGGGGTLILANSGSNNFSGGVAIDNGVLQVGGGGTTGNLGVGNVTNNSTLLFNRSDTHTNSSTISGSGSLTNLGAGVLVLSAANTYEGATTVAQGTLRVANNAALGNVNGPTIVASGATLDVGSLAANALNVGIEPVSVSGAGVGGLGAIINSTSLAQQNALQAVTLDGHTTFGGTGRWDIRGAGAALNTFGMPYNLTKVGANQISLVGAAVDSALANINVQAGLLAFETTTSSLGNPASTLTVSAGATLQFFNIANPMDKVFVLNGNGVATTVNVSSGTGNTLIGPMTLIGDCLFTVTGANACALNGTISGSGSLTKTSTGSLSLAGTNTYTGVTTVNGGTLALTGSASIASAAAIIVNATLDLTGLTAGPTLVLNTGQTLGGNGTINGAVSAAAGSTVAPGVSPGILSVSGAVTLAGTTVMEISKTASTNDQLRSVTGSITYGGTLIVTNLAGTITGGESYKLFDSGAASYLGSFANLQLPPLGAGLSWNTSQLNVSGTVSVSGTLVNPAFSSVVLSGNNTVLSGSGGTANGLYYVLGTTNVALPVSQWTALRTNNFNASGNFSESIPIDPANPLRFYLIQIP